MPPSEPLDRQYLKKLQPIDFQPVFILGLHRSGTSILYKMLTATESFNPITAYHLIHYHELLYNHIHKKTNTVKQQLNETFKKQGLDDRGIDRLQLTADFAEEYGFLLGKKTIAMKITSSNLPLFKEMAQKIQHTSSPQKPLLLKNPYDFSNFRYIKHAVPNAKFVFIHRNPLKTLSSTIKAIRFILKTKNSYTTQLFRLYNLLYENPLLLQLSRFLFSPRFPFGVILLSLNARKATNYYLKNINHLKKEDYICVTYEELCQKPQENMQRILRFLNIGAQRTIDFASFIKPRKTQLDPAVNALQQFIFKTMKSYFTCFEYTL
jgi:hypothetical protein